MIVVNLTGFNYSVKMVNGPNVTIPFFNPPRPVNVPDECNGKFGDGIKILRGPESKVLPKVETKIETKVEEKKRVVKKKPLNGVKIKKKRREELLKYFKEKRESN